MVNLNTYLSYLLPPYLARQKKLQDILSTFCKFKLIQGWYKYNFSKMTNRKINKKNFLHTQLQVLYNLDFLRAVPSRHRTDIAYSE